MDWVATIGFTKKSLPRFVELLKDAGVSKVVDIRRRPDSPLAGFARQRDLPYLLTQLGMAYEHRPELAPSEELLDRYRSDRDWTQYENDFESSVLATRSAEASIRALLEDRTPIALLCSEATPEKCHRRLVAERMSELAPITIRHLV